MTATVLPVGSRGVDGALLYSLRSFQPVIDAGYDFISMYVGGNYGVSKANIQACFDVGLPVQLNFERAANAYTGGAALGTSHANTGLSQARALGWVGESPLVFSGTDEGVTNQAAADAYYKATVDVMAANGAVGGAYGPPLYLRHLAAQPWWPADFPLWQWAGAGNPESWTWVKQLYGTKYVGGVACDENVIYRPMPVWNGFGADPIVPEEIDLTPEESGMLRQLWNAFVNPGSNVDPSGKPISAEWEIHGLYKERQASATPAQIAAAVWASAPPQAQSVLSRADIEAVLNEYIYTPLKQIS